MEFSVPTQKQIEIIDITPQVISAVKDSGVQSGICHVFVAHATAAIIVNENADPNICKDFLSALEDSIPTRNQYLHDLIDGNAAAHIKSALIGPSETVPIREGRLDLGTWQSIMLVELDGPRRLRRVQVSCIAGHP